MTETAELRKVEPRPMAIEDYVKAWHPDPKRKVALLGFASTSRHLAPFQDESIEKWGLNNLHVEVSLTEWHRWFEVHPLTQLNSADFDRAGVAQSRRAHLDWLKAQPAGKPIYMLETHPDVPASVVYPLDAVAKFLGLRFGGAGRYMTSSISLMLGLAIMEGYGWIGLYGVDMVSDEEYFYQRAGAEYLIGIAQGAGITVHVPQESALLKANYVYGHSEPPAPEPINQVIGAIDQQLGLLEKQQDHTRAKLQTFDGAKQAFSVTRTWLTHALRGGVVGPPPPPKGDGGPGGNGAASSS